MTVVVIYDFHIVNVYEEKSQFCSVKLCLCRKFCNVVKKFVPVVKTCKNVYVCGIKQFF